MATINKQNFLFFNKKGDNMNFYFDEVEGIYKGNYVITDKTAVSVDLIESEQLIVLEKVVDAQDGSFNYVKPLTQVNNSSLEFELSAESEEFFFYDIAQGDDKNFYINHVTDVEVPLTYDATFIDTTISSKVYTEVPAPYNIDSLKKDFVTVNIGFSASVAASYIGKVIININENGTISRLAEVFFFADVIAEDPRLPLLLNTLGHGLNNKDFLIFDQTNVKESEIDFTIINKKRKELLLEFHNIFPYLGSYKALINIVKFFGYENLTLKEYWKNVDVNNEKFGYYKGINIEDIFDTGESSTGEELFPSKVYKKTNKFGLYYQITQETGEFDEDGIPIVEETSEFTIQEILIKLFALKEKLKKSFLPFNARIIDIVGEALYYTKIELNYWRDVTRIDNIDVNAEVTCSLTPGPYGFIQDLRPLYWIGTRIGNDLKLDGTTTLKVREFTIANSFYDNKLKIYDAITGIGAEITANYQSDNDENMARLYSELLQINQYPFNKYHITLNSNKILFVEKEATNSNIISYVEQGRYAASPPTLYHNDFFNGNQAVNNFGEAYLGYFFDPDWSIFNLANNEGIPVGYPINLRNTSFDITWEEMQVTWNSLDDYKYYRDFNFSSDAGFPTLQYNSGADVSAGVSWDNAGSANFYEIEWRVFKNADDNPAFDETVKGTLKEYNEWFTILPHPGLYTIELRLYDLYGSFSERIKKDAIEVAQKTPDFTAWKIADRFEATWDDLDQTWDQTGFTWDLPVKNPTTWDSAKIPWYSIDNVEFYQNLAKQDVEQNALEDRNPYIWNNLPDDITWNDMDHLFWDELNPTFSKFYITDLASGGTSVLNIKNEQGTLLESWTWNYTGNTANLYIDFVNEITKLDPATYPVITSFIWDYTKIRNPQVNEVDTVIAISKEFEKPMRYFFDTSANFTVSPYNTPINGYGALGDAPCGFSIFETGTVTTIGDVKISIDGLIYDVTVGVNDLASLVTDLNTNSPFTDEWEFNLVRVITGVGPATYDMKIIAYKRYYTPNDVCNVLYKNAFGTRYGRSITTNATWSTLDVLYYQRDVKKATQVFFTYDISKMPGFTNPVWEIINETTGETVIKYLNKYMSYLFNDTGEYTVKLSLDDTNGNTKTIQKNGLIRV